MQGIGYRHSARVEVITYSSKMYWRQKIKEITGEKELYRSSGEMEKTGKWKNFNSRTWFKS